MVVCAIFFELLYSGKNCGVFVVVIMHLYLFFCLAQIKAAIPNVAVVAAIIANSVAAGELLLM